MELAGTLVLPAAIAFTLYLIIIAIIPGTVKPIISLILLAIILGIPGLLIVMTSRKVAYLGWMLLYLFSLPIWNFVLPAYAFFHMDDFSWGETRKIVGGTPGAEHGDKEGVFDSSHIVMKRWADFERDRRYRSGMVSRDSTYEMVHRSSSPHRTSSNRYSTISSAETYASAGDALFRQSSPAGHSDSENGFYSGPGKYPTQLELPAPLAMTGRSSDSSIASYDAEPMRALDDHSHSSNDAQLPRIPREAVVSYEYPRYAEGYDSDELEREAILGNDSPIIRQSLHLEPVADYHPSSSSGYSPHDQLSPDTLGAPFLPSDSLSSLESSQSGSSQSPFASRGLPQRKLRGVSLVDSGPVPGTEGMRSVQRTRRTSQNPAPSTTRTRNSMGGAAADGSQLPASSLPPGAAQR